MRFVSFNTKRFGGIKDKKLKFEDGINVILGPNEAGKSTLVDAIYNTIFMHTNLKLNRKDDREFNERYMPYPDGDFINGEIIINIEGQIYKLTKEWGTNPFVSMELPDGKIIRDEKKINYEIRNKLKVGAATFGNIVFVKQREIKKAIEKITKDPETTNTVSSMLRKTVMELDGISIEELKNKIDDELSLLLKRWDYKNSRPENPNRRYKKGVGKILESYYEMIDMKQEMRRVEEVEREFENVTIKMKQLEEIKIKLKEEIQKLQEIEDDIFKRATIEPHIKNLRKQIEHLKEINKKWPVKKMLLDQKKEELEKLNKKLENLNEELKLAEKVEKQKQVIDILNKVEIKEKEIRQLSKELEELKDITDEDIEKLEKIQNTITRNQSAIEAATMIGYITKKKPLDIWITRGLENKEKVNSDIEFIANGYLKVEIDDTLELELKSGEIDFEKLSRELINARVQYKAILEKIKVNNIEEAKLKREK
ncbi:AAA family ATPase, partial [Caldisalinibacter kiritimatiensis]|uniref:AAA family ATPase n=1 Tax=Caldisalinibacter kiritimatiensis TaxID=1304284 RepID=UPI000557310B